MNGQDKIQRTVLPIPDQPRTGLITYDAKEPDTRFPPITPLRPPKDAPNVLIVLIDDSPASGAPAMRVTQQVRYGVILILKNIYGARRSA